MSNQFAYSIMHTLLEITVLDHSFVSLLVDHNSLPFLSRRRNDGDEEGEICFGILLVFIFCIEDFFCLFSHIGD